MPRGRTTRRVQLAGGASALPAALALAGCGAAGGTAGPSQPPVKESGTIQVLNADWGQLYNDLMAKIGTEFTAESGIQVEWDFPPDAQEKLITLSAAGTPPDASYTSWKTQGGLAARGVLAPLDDYAKKAGLSAKDFNPAMYDASVLQGKLYALPGGADWLAMQWSKTAYQEAGLDPEKPPKTVAELEQHSERLLKTGPDGYARVGYWPRLAGPEFMYVAYFHGGEFYDAPTNKITANHPKVVEALEWLVGLGRKWDTAKMAAFWNGKPSYSKQGHPFHLAQSGYLFQGFWVYEPLDMFAPQLKYGIAPWPTPTGSAAEQSRAVVQGWQYALPKGTKQAEKGWRFLQYAFVDNAAKMGYLTANGPCYLKQLDEFNKKMVSEVLKGDNRMTPYFKVFTDIARTGVKHFPSLPVTDPYKKALDTAVNDALTGAKPARQALDEATRQMQTELDRLSGG
jgi:ABC-type glycerol-3-phosphate transport system substrate-binding protein